MQDNKSRLEEIIRRNNPKGVVLYPPTLGWSYAHQRPQQIMKAAADAGYLAVFCTTQPEQDHVRDGLQKVHDRLYICDGIEGLAGLRNPILYITWPLHDVHIPQFRDPVVWYDCIDDISLFAQELEPSKREAMMIADARLTCEADIVTATADVLLHQKRRLRPDTILVENGVVPSDFDRVVRESEIPTDIKTIKEQGKPIIGYYGALANWFDYAKVIEIARRRPDWNIVLIGMDYEGSLQRNKAALDACPNIHFLGRKDYEQLYKYSACFDVGLIPFVQNKIIEATNPVKMFEYMAAGIPIVSVDVPEVRKYHREVLTATTTSEYIAQIERAIYLRRDPNYRCMLRETAQRSSWNERVKLLEGEMDSHLSEKRLGKSGLGHAAITEMSTRMNHALSRGEYATAITYVLELRDAGVRCPWLFFNYAQALRLQGEYRGAVWALQEELRTNRDPYVFTHLADVHTQLGNPREAQKYRQGAMTAGAPTHS